MKKLFRSKTRQTKSNRKQTKKIKKEKRVNKRETFKYVVEILEGEIVNETLKMSIIGKTLVEEKISNRKNILKVAKVFRKKGVEIVRG